MNEHGTEWAGEFTLNIGDIYQHTSKTGKQGRDPLAWLSLNQRHHYHKDAPTIRAWQSAAFEKTLLLDPPKLATARVDAYIYKNRRGRYDPHNLMPTLKAIIDGMTKTGIWEDDDYTRVHAGIGHGGHVPTSQPPRIKITVKGVRQ